MTKSTIRRRLSVVALVCGAALSTLSAQQRPPQPAPAAPAPAPQVQIGFCTNLRGLEAAKAAGFDYLELGTSELTNLPDADFDAAVQRIQQLGIQVPVTNLFLPGSVRVTGPDINPEQQMAYVQKAFSRLQRLGTQIVVFGSGGARRVPEGFSKEEAFTQLVAFGKRIAPEARARGITVAVEPLRSQESNIINTAGEGLDLVLAINDPGFELMIDFYHLAFEKEDPAIVIKARDHIKHLHMANPQGRVFPLVWDEHDYAQFFANLRAIGYRGRMSIEAQTPDLATNAPRSIALLRRAFQQP